MSEADVLNGAFAIQGRLSFAPLYGGTVAQLTFGAARADIAIQGAQVLSYEAGELGEVLWLSPGAQLGSGKAVRGGIPICWPWFGPHPDGGQRPAHGFVRAKPWRVTGTRADGASTRITFALLPAELTHPDWPHTADLSLDVSLSDSLIVKLVTHNAGKTMMPLTQALHSYFRVSDIDAVRVSGLEGSPFIDQLDPGSGLHREDQRVHISREVDRIYQEQSGRVTLSDFPAARRVHVAKTGSNSTVLWNPWIDKSARLGDMGENGYRRMVCIETANAGGDVIRLDPGATHTLTARIWAERL